MNFINRLPTDALDAVLEHASKVQVTLHKMDNQLFGSFEIHGDIGDWADDDSDVVEKPDFGLLKELLKRFEQR